jgi:hypothetical protein
MALTQVAAAGDPRHGAGQVGGGVVTAESILWGRKWSGRFRWGCGCGNLVTAGERGR